jgi:hypothetical protein
MTVTMIKQEILAVANTSTVHAMYQLFTLPVYLNRHCVAVLIMPTESC